MSRFENPYNFVPAPPRATNDPDVGDGLGDRGHHAWQSGRVSGTLHVKLTCVTPLLVPDNGREQNGHKTFGVRVDENGSPYLPPTSLRGALRAAYEAVTNSRFGIFDDHDAPEAFRQPASASLKLVPCRVEKKGQLKGEPAYRVRLLPGLTPIGHDGAPTAGDGTRPLMYAAWLPRYEQNARGAGGGSSPPIDKGESRRALTYFEDGSLPQHGDSVWVSVERTPHQRSGRFDFLSVKEIMRADPEYDPPEGMEEGWVFVSGPNIKNKHEERVFIARADDPRLTVGESVAVRWRQLVRNYQKLHEDDCKKRRANRQRPQDYLGHEPGKTGFSRHVYTEGCEHLMPGTLAYAQVRTDANGTPLEITALYPVSISRDLYQLPPRELMDASLMPATNLKHLSPADRVFGWVAQADGKGAWKGLLRIGPVQCLQGGQAIERLGDSGVPLAILGQPKPAQSRFYVAADAKGEPLSDKIQKAGTYVPGQALRGRKVYTHQRQGELDCYWDPKARDALKLDGKQVHREWRHAAGERSDQNRSITAWVKPGTTFECELSVHNLTRVELGALLWLLSLPEDHYLKVGGAKPLGFGSVRVELADARLQDGDAVRDAYRDFATPFASTDAAVADASVAAWKEAMRRSLGGVSFEQIKPIRAFLNAAKGGSHPVHYPRDDQAPKENGEQFKWFVANEKVDHGRMAHGHALPPLSRDDRSLPILGEGQDGHVDRRGSSTAPASGAPRQRPTGRRF